MRVKHPFLRFLGAENPFFYLLIWFWGRVVEVQPRDVAETGETVL